MRATRNTNKRRRVSRKSTNIVEPVKQEVDEAINNIDQVAINAQQNLNTVIEAVAGDLTALAERVNSLENPNTQEP